MFSRPTIYILKPLHLPPLLKQTRTHAKTIARLQTPLKSFMMSAEQIFRERLHAT